MDAHDNLTNLERRLSDWRPSVAGLDVDTVLFAAGRASVRPGAGRFVWPTVSGCLAMFAVALSLGLRSERAERLALAQLVPPQPSTPAPSLAVVPSPSPEPLPRDSYFVIRRLLEQDSGDWLPHAAAMPPSGLLPPSEPILKVGQRGFWPDS